MEDIFLYIEMFFAILLLSIYIYKAKLISKEVIEKEINKYRATELIEKKKNKERVRLEELIEKKKIKNLYKIDEQILKLKQLINIYRNNLTFTI